MVARSPIRQRHIRRTLDPVIQRAAATPGLDRYRKVFGAVAHLQILVAHVLLASASLRQTHAMLASRPDWWRRWGLARWISLSQLARSSTSRPPTGAEALVADLLAAARARDLRDPLARRLGRLEALDHTFIRLSARLSPWTATGYAPGVRLQTALELASAVPRWLVLTRTDVNDHDALLQRDLSTCRGWTILCDLGYYGHVQFARLREHGVHFITKLQPQASWVATAVRAVPVGATPDGDVLLRDWTITLGSPNNRRGAVLPGMRLVSSRNAAGTVTHVVTDRFDLTATEVVRLYRKRWQIELFFRWLKRQLGTMRPLGHSPAAVWLTILVGLAVALVLLLLEDERPSGVSRVAWMRQLGLILLQEAEPD